MTGRLPKGAGLLASIRQQGYRPLGAVFVFLDAVHPSPKIYADLPLEIEICIRPDDRISDLAFWPLTDLDVHVHGGETCRDRLRATLRAILKVRPRFVMGAVPTENLLFAWHPQRGWEFEHV